MHRIKGSFYTLNFVPFSNYYLKQFYIKNKASNQALLSPTVQGLVIPFKSNLNQTLNLPLLNNTSMSLE